MELILALAIGVLTGSGVWLILRPRSYQVIVGLCLLIGAVGMFDLRMMGVARGVTMKELHRLVPFGIAGYLMCATTGFLFVVTAPGQYIYNPAMQMKIMLMAIAQVGGVACLDHRRKTWCGCIHSRSYQRILYRNS